MSKQVVVDKAKFDSLLRKMAGAAPLSYSAVMAKPKLRKDGQPKRSSDRKRD